MPLPAKLNYNYSSTVSKQAPLNLLIINTLFGWSDFNSGVSCALSYSPKAKKRTYQILILINSLHVQLTNYLEVEDCLEWCHAREACRLVGTAALEPP
uniref:Uncharacterized protein MANES_09G009800 n=1 Tax=Rhizophora mucronata TaxID=61149 RepID=A0A2P2JTB6_RHIMU